MSLRKFLGRALSVLTLVIVPAVAGADEKAAKTAAGAEAPAAAASTTAASQVDGGPPRYIRPETPEQRRERLGTNEDPGPDPDADTIWHRFGKRYKIKKFDKQWARYTDTPGFIKPFGPVNFVEELYQENDKWVWVWLEEIENDIPDTPEEIKEASYRQLTEDEVAFIESLRGEFAPLDIPKANTRVTFKRASEGLPSSGSWRNTVAVADMNGDGKMDIVLPPERAGRPIPSIFLGDGKGGWKFWETKWTERLNYGSVVAADFNNDKIMDLAFGVHLSGVAVLLHDGKGTFRQVYRVTDFPTRRIVARDVDADGWTDVVALSEGPVIRGRQLASQGIANLRAFMNRKKGESFEVLNLSTPGQRVSGDWLTAGDFNGDKYPDFAGSNIYLNGVDSIFLSKGPSSYEVLPGGNDVIPFRSYYWANTAGKFSSSKRDDAIVTFSRQWVSNLNPKTVPPPPLFQVAGIDRISFAGEKPVRVPIMRWNVEKDGRAMAVAHGDFNSDGKLDVAFTKTLSRELVLLLGDGNGGFRQATVEGVEIGPQPHYDITVADVNGDKRPDVVVSFEAETGSSFSRQNGKVEVFLNQGAAKAE